MMADDIHGSLHPAEVDVPDIDAADPDTAWIPKVAVPVYEITTSSRTEMEQRYTLHVPRQHTGGRRSA